MHSINEKAGSRHYELDQLASISGRSRDLGSLSIKHEHENGYWMSMLYEYESVTLGQHAHDTSHPPENVRATM